MLDIMRPSNIVCVPPFLLPVGCGAGVSSEEADTGPGGGNGAQVL